MRWGMPVDDVETRPSQWVMNLLIKLETIEND